MNAMQTSFITPSRPRAARARPVMIRELPEAERPVNRLHQVGPSALSTAEIIAAILQTPDALHTAQCLLAHFASLIDLAKASLAELEQVPGIGPAQAARLQAALELGRRLAASPPAARVVIRSPQDAANLLLLDMMTLDQEHLVAMPLDTKNHLIKIVTVYRGSVHSTVGRPAELFRPVIMVNATGVVFAHNHPSGDPTPSPEDVQLTQRLVQLGEELDITVYDHLIIGCQRYVSLRERGLGFK